MDDISDLLLNGKRVYLIAPAGYGKTEEIAKAVKQSSSGRQLILTHTHAGVYSLRKRLQRLNAPPKFYHIDTIAGWALGYASAYPTLSGIEETKPTGVSWSNVYFTALNLLQSPHIKKVIQSSYAGMYVDEYQDCTQSQHKIIMALANILPCRLVGDPLQGIFGFRKDDPLIDWEIDVKSNFESLPELVVPWRWNGENEKLGEWLKDFRRLLLEGRPISLPSPIIINWKPLTPQNKIVACSSLRETSVVAIDKTANQCHAIASRLGGFYSSMEEMDCGDLLSAAQKIQSVTGFERAIAVIDFAKSCMTQISTDLARVHNAFSKTKTPDPTKYKKSDVQRSIRALNAIISSNEIHRVREAFQEISTIDGARIYRRELWREMQSTLAAYDLTGSENLRDTAWRVRYRTRIIGRKSEARVVSRTLLIKGLEYDHAIVLDADNLDAKNLYVAMTRGRKSLTVLSATRELKAKTT